MNGPGLRALAGRPDVADALYLASPTLVDALAGPAHCDHTKRNRGGPMSKREITRKQIVPVPRPSLRELSPAELRLVVGGQEMEHGGRIRR